jgi:hypothetical protein
MGNNYGKADECECGRGKPAEGITQYADLARIADAELGIVEIGQLPLYNQDLDNDPPAQWTAFRERIKASDAVLALQANEELL